MANTIDTSLKVVKIMNVLDENCRDLNKTLRVLYENRNEMIKRGLAKDHTEVKTVPVQVPNEVFLHFQKLADSIKLELSKC